MMDLRENGFYGMFDYAYSWTVINHMEQSRAYLKQLDVCNSKCGNVFAMYPEVIPAYFAATMGLSHDEIFTDIMKNSVDWDAKVSRKIGFYEMDVKNIDSISIGPVPERRCTSTSNYQNEESLAKLVISCSKIAIYHHDDKLLKVLQAEPKKIVNLVAESEQIHPEEHLFFKRLKMMVLSMISVSNPGASYYPLE